MIIDPQSPPIVQQNGNVEPFQTMSLPPEIANAPEAQAPVAAPSAPIIPQPQQQPMLQRSVPPWMQRQQLPPAQPPMYRPQPQLQQMQGGYSGGWGGGGNPFGGGGGYGGGWGGGGNPFGGGGGYGGGWGGPPQMPQWAPPWMTGQWGGPPQMQGGYGGGGWGGGGNQFGGGGNPYRGNPYGPPAAPQYRAPNGNTGVAGPLPPAPPPSAPQYNSQAVRPQPAGTVNQAAPAQPPPMAQNRQAAITPTPIYNRGNEMA